MMNIDGMKLANLTGTFFFFFFFSCQRNTTDSDGSDDTHTQSLVYSHTLSRCRINHTRRSEVTAYGHHWDSFRTKVRFFFSTPSVPPDLRHVEVCTRGTHAHTCVHLVLVSEEVSLSLRCDGKSMYTCRRPKQASRTVSFRYHCFGSEWEEPPRFAVKINNAGCHLQH